MIPEPARDTLKLRLKGCWEGGNANTENYNVFPGQTTYEFL